MAPSCRTFRYSVFFKDVRFPWNYEHVDNPYNLWKNLKASKGEITAINVYNRQSGVFFCQLKNMHETYKFYMQFRLQKQH